MVQITHFVISRNIASHSIAGPRTPASTRATSSVVPVHRQPRETAHFKSRKSLRVRAVDPQILEPAEYASEHDRKIGLCQIGAEAQVKSEERGVGQEGVSSGNFRWSPHRSKKSNVIDQHIRKMS